MHEIDSKNKFPINQRINIFNIDNNKKYVLSKSAY